MHNQTCVKRERRGGGGGRERKRPPIFNKKKEVAFSRLALSQKKGPFPTGTRVQNDNNKSGVLF